MKKINSKKIVLSLTSATVLGVAASLSLSSNLLEKNTKNESDVVVMSTAMQEKIIVDYGRVDQSQYFSNTNKNLLDFDWTNISAEKLNLIENFMFGFKFDSLVAYSKGKDFEFVQEDLDQASIGELTQKLKVASYEYFKNLLVEVIGSPMIELGYVSENELTEIIEQKIEFSNYLKEVENWNQNLKLNFSKNYSDLFQPIIKDILSKTLSEEIINTLNVSSWEVISTTFTEANLLLDKLINGVEILSKREYIKQFIASLLIKEMEIIDSEKNGELIYVNGILTGERFASTKDIVDQISNNNFELVENYLSNNNWSISFIDFVYDFTHEIKWSSEKITINESDFKFALNNLVQLTSAELKMNISTDLITSYFANLIGTINNPNWEAILIETAPLYFEKNKDIFVADLIELESKKTASDISTIDWNSMLQQFGFSVEKQKQSQQAKSTYSFGANLFSQEEDDAYLAFSAVPSASSALTYSEILALNGNMYEKTQVYDAESDLSLNGNELDAALMLVDGSFDITVRIEAGFGDTRLVVIIGTHPDILIDIIPRLNEEEEIDAEFQAISLISLTKMDYELDTLNPLNEANVVSELGINDPAFSAAMSKLAASSTFATFTYSKSGAAHFLDVKIGSQNAHRITLTPQSSATGDTAKAISGFGFGWTATDLGISWTPEEMGGQVDQITLNNKVRDAAMTKSKDIMKTKAQVYIMQGYIDDADFDTLLSQKFTTAEYAAMLQTFQVGGVTRDELISNRITSILNADVKTKLEENIKLFFRASTYLFATQVISDLAQVTTDALADMHVLIPGLDLYELTYVIATQVIANRLQTLLVDVIDSVVLDGDGNPTGERYVLDKPLVTQISENDFEWLLREMEMDNSYKELSPSTWGIWINSIINSEAIKFDTVRIIIGAVDIAEALTYFKSEFMAWISPTLLTNTGVTEQMIEEFFSDIIGTAAKPNWFTVLSELRQEYFAKNKATYLEDILTNHAKAITDNYGITWEELFVGNALLVNRKLGKTVYSDPVTFPGEPTRRKVKTEAEFIRVHTQLLARITDKMLRESLTAFAALPAMPKDPVFTVVELEKYSDAYLTIIDEADDSIDWDDFDSVADAGDTIAQKIRAFYDAPNLDEIINDYYKNLGLLLSKINLLWKTQDELDADAEKPNKLQVIEAVKLEAIRVTLLESELPLYTGKIEEILEQLQDSVTPPSRETVATEVEARMKANFPMNAQELKDIIENSIFKFVFGNIYAPVLQRATQIATEDNWPIQIILSEFEVNNAIAHTDPTGTDVKDKVGNLDKYIEDVAKYALRGKYEELLFEYIAQLSEGRLTAVDAKTYYEVSNDKTKPTLESDIETGKTTKSYPDAVVIEKHAEVIQAKIKKYLEDQYDSFLTSLMKLVGTTVREEIIDYTSLPAIPTSFSLLDQLKSKIGFVAIEGLLNAVKETGSRTWWVPLMGVLTADPSYTVFGDYIKSVMYADYKMWSVTRDKFTEEMLKRNNALYKEAYAQSFVELSQKTTYVSHYFTPMEEVYTSANHGQEFNKSTILWIGPNAIRFDYIGNSATPVAITLAAQDKGVMENISVFYSSAQYSAKNLTFKMITDKGETIYLDQRQSGGRKEIIFQRLKFVDKADGTKDTIWLKSQKIRSKSWTLFSKDYEIVQDNGGKLAKFKNFASRLDSYFPADLEPVYVIEEPEEETDTTPAESKWANTAVVNQRPSHEWEDTKAVWGKFTLVKKGDSMEIQSETGAIGSRLLSISSAGMSTWTDPGKPPIPWFVWMILGVTFVAEIGLVFALVKVIQKQRKEIAMLQDPASWEANNSNQGEDGYWAEDGNYYLYDNNNDVQS